MNGCFKVGVKVFQGPSLLQCGLRAAASPLPQLFSSESILQGSEKAAPLSPAEQFKGVSIVVCFHHIKWCVVGRCPSCLKPRP